MRLSCMRAMACAPPTQLPPRPAHACTRARRRSMHAHATRDETAGMRARASRHAMHAHTAAPGQRVCGEPLSRLDRLLAPQCRRMALSSWLNNAPLTTSASSQGPRLATCVSHSRATARCRQIARSTWMLDSMDVLFETANTGLLHRNHRMYVCCTLRTHASSADRCAAQKRSPAWQNGRPQSAP